MSDSHDRAALLIIDPSCSITDPEVKFLIGCAPNKVRMKSNNWDLIKGHVEVGEDPFNAVIREAKEECGLTFKTSDISLLDIASYSDIAGEGVMALYYTTAPFELTKDNIKANCKCSSFFEWYGRKLPEFCTYDAISISAAPEVLYKKLGPFLQKIKQKNPELEWNI